MTQTEQHIYNLEAKWDSLVERNMVAQGRLIAGLPAEQVNGALSLYRDNDPLGAEFDALEEELRSICPSHWLLPENSEFE